MQTLAPDNVTALAELNALRGAMSSAVGETNDETAALDALKKAQEARATRRRDLEIALDAARRQAPPSKGLAGLGGLRALREPGLGDLAGSGDAKWTFGQYQKTLSWANEGAWSAMLESAARLAFPGRVEPEAVLQDSALRAQLAKVVSDATRDVPNLQRQALAALEEMAKGLRGEPSPVHFDREEYDAAVQGDLQYIKTHKKQGEFAHTLKEVQRVTTTLDTYVPGWGVLLDVATPVLPIAPLLTGLLSSLPVLGTGVKIAAQITPGFGASGLNPLPSFAQTSFSLGQSVAPGWETGLQTVAGPLGAVKFQLTKSTAQAASQGLGVLETMEKIGTDLLDGYVFAASLVGFFVVGPELIALQGALSALKAGVTLAKVMESSRALKRAAAKARSQAQAKAEREDQELRALEAELARLQANLGQKKRAPGLVARSEPVSGLAKLAAGLALAWLASEVLS